MSSSLSVVTKPPKKALTLSLGLLIASLCALAFVVYPIYVIRPFREQTPAALERALWVSLHYKPILLHHRHGGMSSRHELLTESQMVSTSCLRLGGDRNFTSAASSFNLYQHMFHPLHPEIYSSKPGAALMATTW